MAVQIVYNSITLTFQRGPLSFTPHWAPRVHDSLSTSGLVRERVVEAMDILIEFDMPHMILAGDIEAWASFMAWALPGNSFQLYPNYGVFSDYYNCVLEDSSWKPVRNAPRKHGAKVTVRILNDSQAPASPVVVLRRFYGYSG